MTERLVPNDYRKFDASELKFSQTLEKRGGYFFSEVIYGKGENAHCIQTPKMKCTRVGTDSIDLEFPEKHSSFYKAVIQTDEVIKGTYTEYSEKWTKKQVSDEKVNEDFRSSVTVPSELRGMPVLRVYLPSGEGQVGISNQNGDELTLSHLEPGLETVCILELKGIRMKKNYVTPYWEIIQMRVYTNKRHRQPVGKYAFLDDLVSVKPPSMEEERKPRPGVPEEGAVEEIEDVPPPKKVRYNEEAEVIQAPLETPRKKYVSPPPSPRRKKSFLSRAVDSDLEYSEDDSE